MLTDGDVIEVEVLKEPLLAKRLLGVFDISLRDKVVVGLKTWRSSFSRSSAEVRGLVIHDIKDVEGVRQQEEQEDKRDEEIGDEMNGRRDHSPCA